MYEFDFAEMINGPMRIMASMGTQVICALLCALIYTYKGKPWVGGAAMGFFLGPFGVFIALVTSGQGKTKQVYQPQNMRLPKMRTYGNPPPMTEPQTEYRLPGSCPRCNGPVHRQKGNSASIQCLYCGSQIETIPVQI